MMHRPNRLAIIIEVQSAGDTSQKLTERQQSNLLGEKTKKRCWVMLLTKHMWRSCVNFRSCAAENQFLLWADGGYVIMSVGKRYDSMIHINRGQRHHWSCNPLPSTMNLPTWTWTIIREGWSTWLKYASHFVSKTPPTLDETNRHPFHFRSLLNTSSFAPCWKKSNCN